MFSSALLLLLSSALLWLHLFYPSPDLPYLNFNRYIALLFYTLQRSALHNLFQYSHQVRHVMLCLCSLITFCTSLHFARVLLELCLLSQSLLRNDNHWRPKTFIRIINLVHLPVYQESFRMCVHFSLVWFSLSKWKGIFSPSVIDACKPRNPHSPHPDNSRETHEIHLWSDPSPVVKLLKKDAIPNHYNTIP